MPDIFYHPSNKCSKFLLLSLKSFVAEKKHGAMQNLFMKKRKEEKDEYDSPCSLAKLFLNSKREICFQGA